jgi:surface carbohydrate biosynthesis protein (TIGR04326 family)
LKSPQKVLIWDKDGLPKPSDHLVVFWKSYLQNSTHQEISIPDWIAKNQVFVRHQYIDWVRKSYQCLKSNPDLYKKMQLDSTLNYFQLTPLMEMNLFAKSPQISSILRLIAFEAWAEEITLVAIAYEGDDQLLSKAFQGFAIKRRIGFSSNLPPAPDGKFIQQVGRWNRFGISAIKSPIWLFLRWVRSLPLHGLNLKRWKSNIDKIAFYSYFAHFSHTNASKSEFDSAYWGDLPRYLKSIGKHSNWIHLIPTSDGFIASLEKRFILKRWSDGNKSQTHLALESFFSLKIMIRTFLSWYKIRSHAQDIQLLLSSQGIGDFDFWPYFTSELERYLSGVGLVDNLLTYELVKSSIQAGSVSQHTFYLYEGQPWEKVLNSVCAQINHNLPIAVQHSTVRFWDLRYFQHGLERPELTELESYFPRKLIVNGELSFHMLGDRPPQQELIRLESLRYKRNPSMPQGIKNFSGQISPLILGSFLPEDNVFILRLLEESATKLIGIEFTFKPHPLSDNPFLSSRVTIRQSNQELWNLLQGATHVLIAASTSAVIEVIEAEIPFAVFLPPSTVNLSPLNTLEGVDFLKNPSDLIYFLTVPSQEILYRLKVEDLVTPHANLELWKHFIRESD